MRRVLKGGYVVCFRGEEVQSVSVEAEQPTPRPLNNKKKGGGERKRRMPSFCQSRHTYRFYRGRYPVTRVGVKIDFSHTVSVARPAATHHGQIRHGPSSHRSLHEIRQQSNAWETSHLASLAILHYCTSWFPSPVDHMLIRSTTRRMGDKVVP